MSANPYGHWGFNGEWLRKAEITYVITGGDPRDLGYKMVVNHNEELMLISPTGVNLAIGEGGLTIGSISIERRLGGTLQKDIPTTYVDYTKER